MSEYYEVVVAGGGPAGLTVARELSKRGIDVLLLELQAQIGGSSQTSVWIPSNRLGPDFDSANKSSVGKVKLHSVHKEVEIEGDFGNIVDRGFFDKILVNKAVKSGVDIWVSSPVKGFLEKNESVRGVRTESGDWKEDIESEVVIDATGSKAVWSSLFLRKVLNRDWDEERTAQVNEYLMANAFADKQVNIYFNSILAPMGYAWIYPDEEEFALTGIKGVRIHPDSALDEFLGHERPDPLEGSEPVGAYRGRSPIDGLLESAASDGILAVGSSAGHIYPFSGHGMKYALEAGRLAGKVVSESVEEGDTSEERLSEYDRLWKDSFGREIRLGEILLESLEVSVDRKMDSIVDLLSRDPELRKDFIDVFLAENLEESLNRIVKSEDFREILGKESIDKLNRLLS